MLPQSIGSPMDSDAPSLSEQSLPPDICLKSTGKTPQDQCKESDTSSAAALSHAWNDGENHASMEEDQRMDIMMEGAVASDPVIAQSDLLQSACIKRCPSSDSNNGSDIAATLPDLCGGVDSSRAFSLTSDSTPEQRSNLQALPNNEREDSYAGTDCHHGAKPKVFKYSHLSKSKKNTGKISSSPVSLESSKALLDLKRSKHASPLVLNTPHHLPIENCDPFVDESTNSKSHDNRHKLHQQSSLGIDSFSSAVNDEEAQLMMLSSDPASEVNVSNDPATHEMLCDTPALEQGASSTLPDGGGSSECTKDEPALPAEDDYNSSQKDEDCTASLTEDYLLYDSRPISLVACGIWDCDSSQTLPECSEDTLSGLLLVRNNLRSASHPMFARWPCEAYIPSHMLIEVAFNSHGTSLGVSAGSGGNVYGIALGSSVADDSDAQARENEQMKLAKRMGLIHHLPQGTVDAGTNVRECVICMMDLIEGEKVRYLPCMHVYHTHCIDDWFQRSFTCPSCLEPVDAALLNTYNTT